MKNLTDIYLDQVFASEGKNVSLTIEADTHVRLVSNNIHSSPLTIFCGARARVEYVQIFQVSDSQIDQTWIWHLAQETQVNCSFVGAVTSGSFYAQHDFHLEGPGAQVNFAGAVAANAGAKVQITTRQVHSADMTASTVKLHTLVGADSNVSYFGLIDVDKNTSDVSAAQSNKNIITHHSGRVLSVPQLQVRTNKVSCAHGAAIGTLDTDQLMYLQVRGISIARARELLLAGFLADSFLGLSDSLTSKMNTNFGALIQPLLEPNA